MIEIGGIMRPSTWEEADAQASVIDAAIDAAREKVRLAERTVLDVCIAQYPVGSRVKVNIAAGRSPTHEVTAVNTYGLLTLRNVSTGTVREVMANSQSIQPCRSWYSQEKRP